MTPLLFKKTASRLLLGVLFLTAGFTTATAKSLSLEEVLAQVKAYHPDPRIAALQVEKARQSLPQVEGMMDWRLGARVGASHDLDFLLNVNDSTNMGVSLGRQFAHGGTLSIDAGVSMQESEGGEPGAFLPNPMTSNDLILNYRLPLAQGRGNAVYDTGLESAKAGLGLAKASDVAVQNAIATQVMEIFFALAQSESRRTALNEAIVRARELKKYIVNNVRLGLAEERDRLQAEAQLQAQLAEKNSLDVIIENQRVALNRLMGLAWDDTWEPQLEDKSPVVINKQISEEVRQASPTLLINQAKLALAESEVVRQRDAKKSQLDLVVSLGQRRRAGDLLDSSTGAPSNFDETGTAASLQLEYSHSLGNQTFNAKLYQAQIERNIAMENIKLAEQDVDYNLASLLSQMEKTRTALESYQKRLVVEKQKLQEAKSRYRSGRSTTSEILQYESDLSITRLAVEQKQIELNKQHYQLSLMRGTLWQQIAAEKERS